MIKMTILYGQPKNAEAFEAYYATEHVKVARALKGLSRVELSTVMPGLDGKHPAYYRIAELYFENRPHMEKLLGSPEGNALMDDLPKFATGGLTAVISEVA